jgi:hypothetical protein
LLFFWRGGGGRVMWECLCVRECGCMKM